MDRASKDQQRQFLQSLKDSGRLDLLLNELQEAPSGSLASMHDGAKRRMFSPSSEEFDLVEAPALAAEFGVSAQSTPCQSPVVPKSSRAVPGGGGSKKAPPMKVWERTLCELPKYKSKNWCYSEMVAIATSNPQVHSYLGWVTRNGHVSNRVQDFADYLMAIGWTENPEGEEFYYPGTCDVRAFMLHWRFLMAVISAADLLWCKRAVMLPQDQQRQFLQSLKDSGRLDLLLNELQEAPSGSLASMHDGAKRRMFSPSSEEFDLVEAPALAAEFGVSAQSTPCQSPVVPKSSRAVPGGGGSKEAPPMKVWERTLCELPKYKSKNWCYSEMVAIATSNPQVHSYLGWVTRNGHVSNRVQDFADYLMAIGWTENPEGEEFYYPGTCDVRRLK
eukprot:symbB.v1.2.011817.t1/scaffold799.1/size161463/5